MGDFVLNIDVIPSIPDGIRGLLEQAFKARPDPQAVTAVLQESKSLEPFILKLITVGPSHKGKKPKNLDEALSLSGPQKVLNAAFTIHLTHHLRCSHSDSTLDSSLLLQHSLATAVILREIAQLMDVEAADQLFIVGLLHDLGKLVLDALPAPAYDEVIARVKQGTPLLEAEKRVFGHDSREAWFILAENWRFPGELVKMYGGWIKGRIAIPTRKFAEAASRIADTLGYHLLNESYEEAPPKEFDLLSMIDDEDFLNLTDTVRKELSVFGRIYNLPAVDNRNIHRALLQIVRELSMANVGYEDIHHELATKIIDLEMLAKVFSKIIKSLEGDPLTFSVLESVMEGLQVDGAFMLVHEGKGDWSGYAAWTDESGEATVDLIRLSMAFMPSSMLQCIQEKRPIKVDEASGEEVLSRYLGPIATAWLAPAYVKGHLKALVGIGMREEQHKVIHRDMKSLLEILCMEIGLSVENTRLYQQVCKEAGTDPLTRMNNRRAILQFLRAEFMRFKRKGVPLSVALIDLDKFKLINDTLGHPEGDRFLKEAARIIQSGLREVDHVGRYGGDEFLMVLPYTTLEEAYPVALRVLDALKAYCSNHHDEYLAGKISASLGVVAAEYDMPDWGALVKAADEALYSAKESGGSRCVAQR